MTTLKKAHNPFEEDWLDNLKMVLPTIQRLNISENKILIDANRKALFIIGHKTLKSKSNFGMTKIYCEGTNLIIKTTVLFPYLLIGLIFPIILIISIWITSNSPIFNLLVSLIFIWSPVNLIRRLIRQDRFSEAVKKEIEQLNKK